MGSKKASKKVAKKKAVKKTVTKPTKTYADRNEARAALARGTY